MTSKAKLREMTNEDLLVEARESRSENIYQDATVLELADRYELLLKDFAAENVNEKRLELARAWTEWCNDDRVLLTNRLFNAMSALLPTGYDIETGEIRGEEGQ